jgi:hypothetical protein
MTVQNIHAVQINNYINLKTMEIVINEKMTIREFQNQLNSFFPFLKVEFFNEPHEEGKASPKSAMIKPTLRLVDIMSKKKSGVFEFNEETKVKDFEAVLWEQFGLSAQIFRLSSNLWIETSFTDGWSLGKQNNEGEEMSHLHDKKTFDPEFDVLDRDKYE